MGRHFDKLYEEMKADLEGETKANVETGETVTEQNEPEKEPEQKEPDKEPEQQTEPADKSADTAEDKPFSEQRSDFTEKRSDFTEHRDIPDDPVKRAEFSFKRQLSKKDEKYKAELAERDKKYDDLLAKFQELEKKVTPPEKVKTRDEFEDDEDFMDYKVDQRFNKKMAEFEEQKAKAEAELAEKEKAEREQQEELRERQENWLNNVDSAFGGDQERSKGFLDKVAYANKHGLGQVLDNCPVAADYLINDPYGPLVFEKLLNDRQTFERVFDPRRPSPLAVYHELRAVEDELKAPKPAEQPKPATKPVPKMGRPGRQAGGSSMTNTDMWSDPKLIKKWLREHK